VLRAVILALHHGIGWDVRNAHRRIGFINVLTTGTTGAVGVELSFFQGTRARKDVDNLVKLVLDSLNGVAYEDDVHVNVVLARRVYVTKDRARSVIRIFETNEGFDDV
jgi:Holliday junction resolvase RusA-like endonuclease